MRDRSSARKSRFAVLSEQRQRLNERIEGFSLTRFDGARGVV